MQNCYSLQESDLLYEIIKVIKRNEHGLLDFIVQDILRDQDFKDLLDREIEIEDVPLDPEEPEEPKNGMILKIDFERDEDPTQPNIFELYLSGNGYVRINWGDGTSTEVNLTASNVPISHQYDNKTNYEITIYGQENNPNQLISFGSGLDLSETNKYLKEIVSWGDLKLVSLSGALSYTMDTLTVPNELPPTVTNLSYLLYQSSVSEVSNMQDWNTSKVINMRAMFSGAESFNGDISEWDTSSVKNMSYMFSGAESFNGDISKWNTSKVTDMSFMFARATSFNRYIGDWDTSSVENMRSMFALATSFDRDISEWDTSKVIDMSYMFYRAEHFNKNIGRWNTENVMDMFSMFNRATKFDQDLSGWCVENITSEPDNFNTGSEFANNDAYQPDWGSCPS